MDPLADKLLITAALVSLVQMDLAPAWMVAVILGREFAVTVLRSIAHARGVVIPASPLGKFKMVSQVVAILLLILGHDHLQQFFVLGRIALWVAVVTAVVSGDRLLPPLQPRADLADRCTRSAVALERRLRLRAGGSTVGSVPLDLGRAGLDLARSASCASSRNSLFSNSFDQPVEVGQRFRRPLDLDQRLAPDRSTPRRGW